MIEIGLIIGACFLGGLVQGAAGFGIGLVSMGLLGLVMPVRDAAVINVLAALCVNFFMVHRLRSHLSLRRILPVMPAVLLGAPLGVWLLVHASIQLLNILLAAILLLAGLQSLLREHLGRLIGRPWHPWFLGVPCGLLSGGLAGAYGTGGPPVVAFVLSQRFERRHYAGVVQLLLALGGLVRVFEMSRRGLILEPGLPLLLGSALAAVTGAGIGILILCRVPEKVFQRSIAVFLLLLAIRYILI